MSDTKIAAPYGSWASPITAESLTGAVVSIKEPGTDTDAIYWLEGRPAEKGRSTLIRLKDGVTTELTPNPFDVRTRAHEYGGGSWTARDGVVLVSNGTDGRIYRVSDDGPAPITAEGPWRFADLLIDPHHNRIIAVREDHTLDDIEAINTLVQLELDGPNEDGGQVIVSGTDFVASPALSPDGTMLSWLQWNHPNMPWDGCELWYSEVEEDGTLHNIHHVTGGLTESIVRPRWNNTLLPVFASDRTGWWQLYADRGAIGIQPIMAPTEAEFAQPQWVFGMSTWDFTADGRVVCAWNTNGEWHLGRLDVAMTPIHEYDLPFTAISDVHVQQSTDTVIFLGASPTDLGGLVQLDLATGEWQYLRQASAERIDPDYISVPESISWTSEDGSTAYGFYYAPANRDFTGPDDELPPLIVESHGGPTSQTSSTLSLKRQFWTSRGFAILDVNYGGSTGYGRDYRNRLQGTWGIVDVDDCVTGAEYMVDQGLVDPARLAIRGGSAGGFTTLAALTTTQVFAVGVSYFGIGDLEAMARDTHKFESRYLDGLVGPYPEAKQTYIDRSAVHHVDRLEAAMLLLQGLEDKVVPPNQATMMAEAVRQKSLPVAHIEYEGEGHGFRQAATIQHSTLAELAFFARVFVFTPVDDIPVIDIANA
ncbi:MAG: prolyl oligopeptidase family serine peptidase [Thermomicrobiales bacterium]|nr:prolyl oligopeptidase family serine peptidase [Thermomicrobiales bacterium]